MRLILDVKKLFFMLLCLFTVLPLLFITRAAHAAPQGQADAAGVELSQELPLNSAFYQKVTVVERPDAVDVLVNKNYILPADYQPSDLENVSPKYSRGKQRLRREARIAFEAFAQAVYDHTKNMPKAISTFRAFEKQISVYLKYKSRSVSLESYQRKRDRVSARPGHSEHQLGLTVDVISCTASIENTVMYQWYKDHAHEYGFILRYPKGKEAVTGYLFEPWHLRYLGVDLATSVYLSGLTYDEYYSQQKAAPKAG